MGSLLFTTVLVRFRVFSLNEVEEKTEDLPFKITILKTQNHFPLKEFSLSP